MTNITVDPKPFVTAEIVEDPWDVSVVQTFSTEYPEEFRIVGYHIRASRRCKFSVDFLVGARKEPYLDWEEGVRIVLKADNMRIVWREVAVEDLGYTIVGEMPD